MNCGFYSGPQPGVPGHVVNLPIGRFHQGGSFSRRAPEAWHEMIVAIACSMLTNKKVYICFISALAMMLAASPSSNLFAAGIPVNFDRAISDGTVKKGDVVMMAAFAHAGDFAGAAAVKWGGR